MATIMSGVRVFGSPVTLHTRAGRLMGYQVSHAELATRTVTFHDGQTTGAVVLHKVHIAPERCPSYLRFGYKPDEGISFENGLTVDPGDCEVTIWSISY